MNFDRRALAALTAAGILWGTTMPATKLAVQWLPPGWLTVVRFALAAAILLVARRSQLRSACSPAILAWGAIGYGGTIFVQNAGILRTSVTHAALLVGTTPVLVAVIAAVGLRSIARPAAWAGYLLSVAGVVLVAGQGGGSTLSGDGLILVSLLMSAAFTVRQAALLRGRDPVAVTAVQFAAAAVVFLPVTLLTEGLPPAAGAGAGLPVVLFLVLAGTLAPFTLFAYAQARVAPSTAAAFLNLEPLVGAAIGIVAFGDPFGLPQLLGAAAILAGIALGGLPARSRRARRAAPAVAPAAASGPAAAPASGPVAGDELVHERVDARVGTLPRRVLVVPGHDLPGALLERDRGDVAGHDAAQLGVVEHQRVRLVAEQPGAPVRVGRRDGVRRNVHDIRAHARRRGQRRRDLVPGQHVIGGDVERLADRARVTEQRHEPAGEVCVMRQRPQRGAITVHHNGLALAHPADRCPAAVQGDEGLVVGVRGPDDRGREPLRAIGRHQQVLAGDLVAGVPPERVA
jgi:drug/metabolite transporter (DMT)-like permease